MPKLNIVGWREGLLKISMTHLLQEYLSLTLTDAKATVDALLLAKLCHSRWTMESMRPRCAASWSALVLSSN